MNSPLINNSETQYDADPVHGPGHSLRLARQAKGFEIASISSQLHLHPDKIEALEQDRYEDLAGSVFVSGYIRNYARLLGLDPEPLLAAYQAADPNAVEVPKRVMATPSAPRRETRSNDLVVRLASLVIVLGIAGLFGTWWMNRSEPVLETDPPDGYPPPNELAEPVDQTPLDEPVSNPSLGYESEPATAATDDDPGAFAFREPAPDAGPAEHPTETAAAESTSQALTATELAPTTEPIEAADTEAEAEAEAEMQAASAEDASPSTAEVVLEFSGPCWVDVRDSTRTFKLFGEQNRGDRFVLEGTPPYDMVLGNAAAVRIEVNGEAFDLASRSKGNVARFQLDPNAAL